MPLTPHLVDLNPWKLSAEAATEVVISIAKRHRRLAEKSGVSEDFLQELERELHTLTEFIGITEATIEGLVIESRDEYGRMMRQRGQWDFLNDWARRMEEATTSPHFRQLYPALLAEYAEYDALQSSAA